MLSTTNITRSCNMCESVSTEYWIDTDKGNRTSGRKTCPIATFFFTTNPTWTTLGSNPGFRDERPATAPPQPWHSLLFPFYVTVPYHVGVLLYRRHVSLPFRRVGWWRTQGHTPGYKPKCLRLGTVGCGGHSTLQH